MPLILSSANIYLTPITLKHCDDNYLSWFYDDEVNKYIESAKKKMQVQDLIDFVIENQRANNLFMAIHLKSTNKHIGNMKIEDINHLKKSGEYGILFGDKEYQGKGYAKEASILLINYCFKELKLETIMLGVVKEHLRAVVFYKQLGFEIEKTLYNATSFNGEEKDVLRMFVNKEKWKF